MTEQEFMLKQRELRAIKMDVNASAGTRQEAQAALDALIEAYKQQFPLITGTSVHTQEQVDEAEAHGF